ncbi:helix-turn-helix transcriptional regulator [Acinetobacter silvestris]|uniref:Transcriptional regulator n=1 Tax=Acinetobacter silvestris TaxID=1977882 RepID=A0A1Y3CLX8_9GAMM|nr:hypothetical protein [Acinetobacter silvestris]OTG67498.1 hypothetical protein B9T28_02415 [Acinetobacter silvestris]
MIKTLGQTQQNLLHALHVHPSGLSMGLLVELLEITRTAIRQHIFALETQGFIQKGQIQASGGRPSQFYQLSSKGFDLFPKQYALFSKFLLSAALAEKGEHGLSTWLNQLGMYVAQDFKAQMLNERLPIRLIKTVNIMNTLAYDAALVETEALPAIEANNCVYHDLAREYPQVCQFDLALLSELTESKVTHEKCMQKGDPVCRFCFSDMQK